MADVAVAAAQRRDLQSMARVLARAFQDDPVMMWVVPEPAARARALPRMFATMIRHHYLRSGAPEVAGGTHLGAAALWDPPGGWRQSRLQELRMMPGFLRALGRHVPRAQQLMDLMHAQHPEEPHWYLAVIGSDPTVRGTGYGQTLMRSRLDRCDAEYAPAYLESSNPANVPYYERFGFQVTGEITVPDGPTLWKMWREPR
ncbi:acetyltransferase [Mycolicibacterium phlei]|uniref:Acetyltransferase n=1 Tax=Mycolicibacterium phlei DSM 43239 = CCUG 21000 TaxID=1226750 RepID=A0A5N5V5W8_MYCPH|nr:GNAT family N-acetyltransferase [Mycolicibacterium phlei]VEG10432.1 acetyltransferase [Mycobacteroides chelonae]AMO62330.1 Acetyltransferase (GNAT) family protein [Mycolicibacterium phlei]KAB7757343.1 acetyltransferase [Mycolicibacterium phlei DSM 43239 = CCUG 21000]KXW66239.1 acetyltransferase [Mycolicibacterium phlei DSM 43239 = CCUG 21000]KXW67685.1 acetyltransferase [Mycolicibacterium phlei DSM 43070]